MNRATWALAACVAIAASAAHAQREEAIFPGRKGGQDTFGQYAVVADWPKPLAQLPGHAGWTYGAAQSVFAVSPDRIFVLQRGELPALERPATQRLRDVENRRHPCRDARALVDRRPEPRRRGGLLALGNRHSSGEKRTGSPPIG